MTSIDTDAGGLFFLDAPRETSKTFIINLILAKVRQHVALTTASSGIAVTLLEGGKMAHSAFKLPLNLNNHEKPTCNIGKHAAKAHLLRISKVIIWDEATMSHKKAFEALDKTLQDLHNNNRPMGGVTMVLSGDFRQTLHVIPRETRANEVRTCIKNSYL